MVHFEMKFYVISLLCFCVVTSNGWSDTKQRRFQEDFMFGAASSAYQVEGGWDADGKGPSIWDTYLHNNPHVITDGRNGDVASDSYHLYERDVQMLRELGVDHYRFSVSWPRVMPTGLSRDINEKAFQYYDNLINALLLYNIQPVITLYHFDLPQKLQDLGGWTNPLITQWFEDYSRVIFNRYGNKVKYWVTVNQPDSICRDTYGAGLFAPGIISRGIGEYICVKNVLLAHARAYRLYEREFKKKYKGNVGISLSINWMDPLNNKTENVKAAEEYREFTIGLFANPILSKSGDFPKVVKDIIAKKSKEQGFPRSRLPSLSKEEVNILKGSADFLGMNHYTTFLVSRSKKDHHVPSFADDANVDMTQGEQWKKSVSGWLRSAPYGIYKACLHLNQIYDYPHIFITEHGWSSNPGMFDEDRVDNMRSYLNALLLAIEDGTRVIGYTAWSLMDNVEWIAGTSERFGLYEVDFDSAEKTRTARQSALVYKRIIKKRLIDDWKPKSLDIKIDMKEKTEL